MGDADEVKPLHRPIPATVAPRLPAVTSRWQKGQLTFGPVGRICWTAAIVLVPLFTMTFGGVGGVVFIVLWVTVVAPMALKDIWQKATVYVPVPPHAPERSLTAADGTRMPTLSEYVAQQGRPPMPPPPPPPGPIGS